MRRRTFAPLLAAAALAGSLAAIGEPGDGADAATQAASASGSASSTTSTSGAPRSPLGPGDPRATTSTLGTTTTITSPSPSPSPTPSAAPGTTAPATSRRTAPTTAPPAPAPTAPTPGVPVSGACSLFPADSYWHADVRGLPVHAQSSIWKAEIGTAGLHPDFGSGTWDGGPIGIPYVVVPSSQPPVGVSFYYDDESDAGPYPIPGDAPIEGGPASGGDRHVLVVQEGTCTLSELFDAHPNGDGSWSAGSGAVWSLGSNALRPDGWTSADAAGLPILPGLVRYDEVAAGVVDHAIRFTAPRTAAAHLWPARHDAGQVSGSRPPMGAWLRLRGDLDPAAFPPQVRPIIVAMQVHGILLADNGSAMYLSGAPDPRWDNDQLHSLGAITTADFEVVDASSLMLDPDSGAVG